MREKNGALEPPTSRTAMLNNLTRSMIEPVSLSELNKTWDKQVFNGMEFIYDKIKSVKKVKSSTIQFYSYNDIQDCIVDNVFLKDFDVVVKKRVDAAS
jgi:hypothetical protein